MYYYDRMQKTRKIGDRIADKIIERLLNYENVDLEKEIDLVLKLAQLVKIMDDFESDGFEGKD